MAAVVWSVESHITFSPFIFLASDHFQESLVWLQDPGFCYRTDYGLSLVLLLGILLLGFVWEILRFWICRFIPFIDMVDIGMG